MKVFHASEKSTLELKFNACISFVPQSSFFITPFKDVVIYYHMSKDGFSMKLISVP